jgi:ABC-type multidrug transport system permease subunit
VPVILTFADVQVAFEGRSVLSKHKGYNMFRPSALFLAQTLADLPLNLIQLVVHNVIIYFMGGFQSGAGLFFAFLLFSFTLTGTITALFRAVGYAVANYNDATKITGGAFTAFVIVSRLQGSSPINVQYSGYVIYQPAMHPWLSWIRWLNPLYYLVEADLANELDGLTFACAPPQLAPYGEGYEGGPQACAITGAGPGSTFVTGSAYLDSALGFSKSHVWRNWGIVLAWWAFYILLGCLAVESIPAAGASKGVLLYKRGSGPHTHDAKSSDVREDDDTEETTGT